MARKVIFCRGVLLLLEKELMKGGGIIQLALFLVFARLNREGISIDPLQFTIMLHRKRRTQPTGK